ncbi:MAG: Abi family protein [Raoultibacter sp.]
MDYRDPGCLDAVNQIAYMRDKKGVAFKQMSEAEALYYLNKLSYFYKVKSFAKNFDKYNIDESLKGVYINLDFGYLVELERLDNLFRETILRLTLDIEHSLKTRINASAMKCAISPISLTEAYLEFSRESTLVEQSRNFSALNVEEAIHDIKKLFFEIDINHPSRAMESLNAMADCIGEVTLHRDPDYVAKSIRGLSSSKYSGGIVRKHQDSVMPYWCMLELISFGPLISLYKQCFKKDGLINDEDEARVCKDIKNMLRQVQSLRNAAAHGDSLLNTLSSYSSSSSLKGIRRKMIERGMTNEIANRVASVPVALEFTSILMCYEILVPDSDNRQKAVCRLSDLATEMQENKSWFEKCYPIKSFLDYMDYILPKYAERFEGGDQLLSPLSSTLSRVGICQ